MDSNASKIVFVDFPNLLNEEWVKLWLLEIANKHEVVIQSLCYNFVPREKIEEINAKYLSHHYPTDIITFGYDNSDKIEADIFICPDVVFENALEFNQPKKLEFLRVISHGLLHLSGFDDTTPELKTEMRKAEEQCLNDWKKIYGEV